MNYFSFILHYFFCWLPKFSSIHNFHCPLGVTATNESLGSKKPKTSMRASNPTSISFSRKMAWGKGNNVISESRHKISSIFTETKQDDSSSCISQYSLICFIGSLHFWKFYRLYFLSFDMWKSWFFMPDLAYAYTVASLTLTIGREV